MTTKEDLEAGAVQAAARAAVQAAALVAAQVVSPATIVDWRRPSTMADVETYRQSRRDLFSRSASTMGKRAFGHRITWRHCRSYGTRYKKWLVLVYFAKSHVTTAHPFPARILR